MKTLTEEFCAELADYLEDQNNSLAQDHTIPPDGPFDDPEVAEEVERVDGWIKVLRASDTSGCRTTER
jgi:hypothetical protein